MAKRAPKASSPLVRLARAELLVGDDHLDRLVARFADAKVSLWIATANVKEMRVPAPIGTRARAKGGYVSIVSVLDGLAKRGVELRLLHATRPSRAFLAELDRHPELARGGLDLRLCPRTHMKVVAIDGAWLYLGSANLTGAGLGAKAAGRRNFELGVATDDDGLLDAVQAEFDRVFSGRACAGCRLRSVCPAPIDESLRARG